MLFFLFFLYEFFSYSLTLNITTCSSHNVFSSGVLTTPKSVKFSIDFINEQSLQRFKFFEVTIKNITNGTQDEIYLMDCDETRNITLGLSKIYYPANNTAKLRFENFSKLYNFTIKNIFFRVYEYLKTTTVDLKFYGFDSDTIPLEASSFQKEFITLEKYSDCIYLFFNSS